VKSEKFEVKSQKNMRHFTPFSRESGERAVFVLIAMLAFATASATSAGDWLQFRGNDSTGVGDESDPPKSLDKIAWTADLKGQGTSSPIISGDKIVLTSNTGAGHERLHVTCFDKETGKEVWERQFWATGSTQCFQTISMAVPSPACDGQRVYAFYSCNDLVCLDLDGNLVWYRALGLDYPNASNSLGMASSPVVCDGTVVVQLETDDDSLALGIDALTGETRWKLDRPRKANWTSPFLVKATTGETLVALQGAMGLLAVRPATGETVWTFDYGAGTIPSSSVVDNVVFVSKSNFTAIEVPEAGKKPKMLWNDNRLSPKTASPVVHDGKVYVVNDAGVLNCGDATNGKILWRLRLTGPFTSSPVAAADRFYIFNEAGIGQLVQLGDKKGEVASTRDLAETIWATPSIADGALYIRSDKHLWKFTN
jgi:outer membrane protein assembly factor BamB